MPVFAAIDVGSNSCRIKIARVVAHRLKVLHEDREVTRLGSSVFASGLVSPEAMAAALRALKRFQREIQLARRVTHPNVCRVFEVGVHQPAAGPPIRFFTMELLNGDTLTARLRDKGKLTRREAYPIGQVPAGGLVLTAGADVQHKRIEVEVVAWGPNKESWSVDYRVFEGDTSRPQVWEKLTGILNETFATAG